MNLLHIESSLFAENGVSSQLSRELISQLKAKHSDITVNHKNFALEPVPHFDGNTLNALMADKQGLSEQQKQLADYSNQQIEQVQEADVLVIGVPMYNFGIPSMLKAWFDHIARAGVTFRYTENGPEGLLKNKKVYIVASRGGIYKDTQADSIVPFLSTLLNFLGMDDIEYIYAEGLNMGDDKKAEGMKQARDTMAALIAA